MAEGTFEYGRTKINEFLKSGALKGWMGEIKTYLSATHRQRNYEISV